MVYAMVLKHFLPETEASSYFLEAHSPILSNSGIKVCKIRRLADCHAHIHVFFLGCLIVMLW